MRAAGIIRHLSIAGIILGMVLTLARAGSGTAQSADGGGFEAFSRAVKAYDSGDWNKAAGLVDDAFQAGLSKEMSARATLLRAQIYERSGAFARALQDYSNALWMGTLPAAEQKKAAEGKQRVIAALGLSPAAQGSKQASGAGAPQSSPGGVLGMFDGVFGSSKPAAAVPPTPPPAPVQAAPPAPATGQAAAASSASGVLARPKEVGTQQAKAAAHREATKREKPPVPAKIASIQPVAIAPASSANGFVIIFGSAPTEAAGRTRAQQIKIALADILVSRELDVDASPSGGFQITAGPYKAKSAALALCSAMKQRGVACQVAP